MKKRLLTLAIITTLATGVLAGCSAKTSDVACRECLFVLPRVGESTPMVPC